MAIITLAEVKTYLGISTSANDSIISTLIPEVEFRVADICNTYFKSDLHVDALVEYSAGNNTIDNKSTIDWTDYGFATSDYIVIECSYKNDGYHTILSVNSDIIEITSATTVVSELSGAVTSFSVVQFPKGIKSTVAQMIKYDYETRPKLSNVTSESIGSYSYSQEDSTRLGAYGYPQAIIGALNVYKVIRFV